MGMFLSLKEIWENNLARVYICDWKTMDPKSGQGDKIFSKKWVYTEGNKLFFNSENSEQRSRIHILIDGATL